MSQINLTELWSKFTSYLTKQMHKFILLHSLILNFTCVCDVYLCMCMYTCMSVNVVKWMLKSAYGTLGVSPYLPPCLRQWPFVEHNIASYPDILIPISYLTGGWPELQTHITGLALCELQNSNSGSYPCIASALPIESSPQVNLKFSLDLPSSNVLQFTWLERMI